MERYNERYNHWFWNSQAMIIFSQKLSRFSAWLWRKMYN